MKPQKKYYYALLPLGIVASIFIFLALLIQSFFIVLTLTILFVKILLMTKRYEKKEKKKIRRSLKEWFEEKILSVFE